MGVHARPAAMIVRIASRFNGEIWVTKKDGDRVNAKSIMGIMMLAAAKGQTHLRMQCGSGKGTGIRNDGIILLQVSGRIEEVSYFPTSSHFSS